jgi:hypothetical protein
MCVHTHITRNFNEGEDRKEGATLTYLEKLLGTSAQLVTEHVAIMGATMEIIKDMKKDAKKMGRGK